MNRVACFLLTFLAMPAFAQERLAERRVLPSRALGEEREIWIHLPRGYEAGGRHPVLYVLDGQSLLVTAAGQTEYLTLGDNGPALIVVGITSTSSADRRRNMIADKEGGADAFLAFLVDEVKPYIEKSYRTEPFSVLAGHSLGGLFALHALATRPASFSAFIAVSPPLRLSSFRVVHALEALLASAPATRTHLFLAMGEEGSQFPRQPFLDLVARLHGGAREPFRWKMRLLDDESHVTTFAPALWSALRWLYAGWSTDAVTVAALEQHHAELTRRLGYPIPVPESRWLGAGYQRLDAKDPTSAVALFERATRDYATSANAWDSLADGYEAAGRLDDAERAVARAITLAPAADRATYLAHQTRLRAARRPR